MKIQLAHISILQSSKIMTALNALFGLFYSLVGIPLVIFGTGQMRIIGIIYLFGPLFMAVVGFFGFCLASVLYNTLAKIIGGIEVDIKIQAPAPALEPA